MLLLTTLFLTLTGSFQICVDHEAKSEEKQIVQSKLIEHNKPFIGNIESFCIFLKDENDEIRGGAMGHILCRFDMLSLDCVFVDQSIRGQSFGTQLLQEVEKEARLKGCKMIMLDTFSFQAEGFYSKLGYEKIGVIENQIGRYDRIYMKKEL